jgi:ribosome biogenesis GTPase
MSKKRKIRVDLRKNRSKPPRDRGWTRAYQAQGLDEDAGRPTERVVAKGDLSRRRTIIAEEGASEPGAEPTAPELLAVDLTRCRRGRVLKVHSLQHVSVASEDGQTYRCAVRRLLRSLVIEESNVVACGDQVWFRPAGADEGMIEKVEPRYGLLTRETHGKEQVLVANVDQLVVVASLAEPGLKPHLVDRYLVCAEQGKMRPVVCLNKADLVSPAAYQAVLGLYSQLGVPVVLTSTRTGDGVERLRELVKDRETVFAGQSGVGKSSLLNAIEPGLGLRVREVSDVNQKGKHTTTTAELIQLAGGGWVVDTPGVRQFGLWKIVPQELDGLFREFRPFVSRCRFPGCSHTHEEGCGVKLALDRGWVATQRYESYLSLYHGEALE